MSELRRNKVLSAFKQYAEGGTLRDALAAQGMASGDFYKTLRVEPELKGLYHEIQEGRADMAYDEMYSLASTDMENPHAARVKSQILERIAAAYDRKRFGEKLDVSHEAGPSLTAAIEAARLRSLQPPCDLGATVDAEFRMIEPPNARDATDCQSAAPLKSAALRPANPFED